MRATRSWAYTVGIMGLAAARPAMAAAPESAEGIGLWAVVFLAFAALVIGFQAIPALVLFGSMLKALFAPGARRVRTTNEAGKSARS